MAGAEVGEQVKAKTRQPIPMRNDQRRNLACHNAVNESLWVGILPEGQ